MPRIQPVSDMFHVCAQLQPKDLREVAQAGYATVVCMRPDGEAPGQPPADEVRAAADALGLAFHHIPVRSGDVALEHARRLRDVLDRSDGPILSYCASGNRCAIAYQLTLQSAG